MSEINGTVINLSINLQHFIKDGLFFSDWINDERKRGYNDCKYHYRIKSIDKTTDIWGQFSIIDFVNLGMGDEEGILNIGREEFIKRAVSNFIIDHLKEKPIIYE